MLRYKSDYPNQVHQLVVSVSRHLHITRSGYVRYQKKELDVNLQNVSKSDKEHIVHYLIRDHFSGLFYGEICSSSNLMQVEAFLLRAWSRKDEYIFCGIPGYLSIPKTVSIIFPSVHDFIRELGIETVEVTSGFQGGVRDIRTWENYLRQVVSVREETKPTEIQSGATRISEYLNDDWEVSQSKMKKWADNINEIRVPSGEKFVLSRP
ncbi:MAG: hypothetical protein QOJ02_4273 [Acidobacteriota bacterium]|nr:hypothetical protein [Acidobacteriota bacterium]